jgi:hypothetical protein
MHKDIHVRVIQIVEIVYVTGKINMLSMGEELRLSNSLIRAAARAVLLSSLKRAASFSRSARVIQC